jgi:hypothetical protein
MPDVTFVNSRPDVTVLHFQLASALRYRKGGLACRCHAISCAAPCNMQLLLRLPVEVEQSSFVGKARYPRLSFMLCGRRQ